MTTDDTAPPRKTLRGLIATFVAFGLMIPLGLATSTPAVAASTGGISDLRADNTTTPFGVDGDGPTFSWQLTSTARGAAQTAYQVRVAKSVDELGTNDIWSSGRVASDTSTFVDYQGPALDSQSRYYWQVRIWDENGAESEWSEATWFETGILDQAEWTADWIGGPDDASRLADWTDYEVSVDFTLVPGTAFGIFLRSPDENNALMWQVNDETAGKPMLRPHTLKGNFALLGEVDLTSTGLAADVLKHPATIKINAQGGTITTRINDVVVDTRSVEMPHFEKGFIGVRTSASTTAMESVLLHRITVQNSNAMTLLDTSFENNDNPFGAGTLTAEGLELTGNHKAFVQFGDQLPLLRKKFDTGGRTVVGARMYSTARGVYELSLNGQKVGDEHLAPGWTDYGIRIEYQTYDVTDLVRSGNNALGAMIAPGWFSGRLAHIGTKNYGTEPSLIAQLRIDYSDGTQEIIATDGSWKTAPGPYKMADLIEGEEYLAAYEQDGWDEPDFDESGWASARVATAATAELIAQDAPPVRTTEARPALSQTEPTAGAYVYDMGQNMVGVVRVTLRGDAGTTVRIRYGEELNPDGTLYTANLRSARATDYYTFDEAGEIVYEPRFTFHGFRYVEVTGTTSAPTTDELTGLVWGSDLDVTGEFTTSNGLINQLQSNITWGQRGNFLSIPTDTPARDERLGWSGDINVFAPTASFNTDSLTFLSKWLVDLQDAQQSNGDYRGVAPYNPKLNCCGGGTGWSDAGITVPWVLWQSYGGTRQISDGWASMTRYMDFLENSYPTHVRGSSYADWLHLDDPTPGEVLGTAYYAYVAGLMAEMAGAIGDTAAASHYAQLAEDVTTTFRDRFISADGTVYGDSQAGYAIAIGMGLVSEEALPAVSKKFVATLERRDFHLSTGFLGTPWLVSSLAESGNLDIAYQVLLNEDYPSWGYEIANGATTIWERWNSIMPDGSFGDVSMNSFNHYAYGAVGDWMYRRIGGIEASSPGYQSIVVDPQIGGGLTQADTSFKSVYGTYRTAWQKSGSNYSLQVTVPANASATVVLPVGHPLAASESGSPLSEADGVGEVTVDGDTIRVEISAGSYEFVVDGAQQALAAIAKQATEAAKSLDALKAAQTITDQTHATATTATSKVQDLVTAALAGDAETQKSLADILSTLDEVSDQLGTTDDAKAALEQIRLLLQATGVATAQIVGVNVSLNPQLPAIPGSAFQANVVVENESGRALTNLSSELLVPPTWEPQTGTNDREILANGERDQYAYRVAVPSNAQPGDQGGLIATTRITVQGHRLIVAAGATVELSSPISVGETATTPDTVRPGEVLEITVPVTNSSESALALHAEASLPAAWNGPARSDQLVVGAGETVSLTIRAVVPLSVTASGLEIPVSIVRGGSAIASGKAAALIALDAVQYDAVDLGNTESEQAHALTAHPNSGVNTEAGLTRRYSGMQPGDSWFEFDVAVPAGKPFTVRLVETYGSLGTKGYTVSANGTTVFERTHTAGPGTAEAMFTVDDPEISQTGTVRLRFQHTGQGAGDPSIANVWVYDTSVTDHVDLGFGYSENTHNLGAAASSGTSVEAGYTRRYSGIQNPGSWFEFDMAVPEDSPVLLRVRETYNGPQTKEYSVIVNDVLLEERALTRTETAPGIWDYQILVDDPQIVPIDGTVRVRMQKSQSGSEKHDPSVADAWVMSVPPDVSAPVVSMVLASEAEGAAGWHREPVIVELYAQDDRDADPRIEYAIGDGEWQVYSEPFAIEQDGVHEVHYRAIDQAGNVSESAIGIVRIDTEGPVSTVAAAPGVVAAGWHGIGTKAIASGEDTLSGVSALEIRMGGAWEPYEDPVALPHGDVDIEVRAWDVAGNLGEVAKLSARVDTIAPEVAATVSGAVGEDGWLVGDAFVTVEAVDADSGIASVEYLTDRGWQIYSGPVELGEGMTTVNYRATDVAGNVSAIRTVEAKVDRDAPKVKWVIDAKRNVSIAVADATSGVRSVEYEIGGAGWKPYSTPVTVSTESHPIRVRAVDLAGNKAEAQGILVGGKLSATVVSPGDSIDVTGAGYAPGESVRIELHSEPVLLKTVVADDDGQFAATATIPIGTVQKAHEVVFLGEQGSEVHFEILVNSLAATGMLLTPYVLGLAALLAIAGGSLVIWRRKNR